MGWWAYQDRRAGSQRPRRREHQRQRPLPSDARTPLVEKQIADQAALHGIPESEVLEKVLLDRNAVKRLIEPAEVAGMAAFLCRDDMWSVTGRALTMGRWLAVTLKKALFLYYIYIARINGIPGILGNAGYKGLGSIANVNGIGMNT